jgi:hypothetical protein
MIVGQDPGRPPSNARDRAELRSIMQDEVLKFTVMRREHLLPLIVAQYPHMDSEWHLAELDRQQPLYEEYDPVVALAVMAADHENSPELRRQAASDAAQYVRPKLRAVDFTIDPASTEAQAERARLADRLVGLLEAGAAAKRSLVVDGEARDVTPTEAQSGSVQTEAQSGSAPPAHPSGDGGAETLGVQDTTPEP